MPTTSLELLTCAVQTKTNNHPFITNARNARDGNGIYFGWEITRCISNNSARNISFSLQENLANCGEGERDHWIELKVFHLGSVKHVLTEGHQASIKKHERTSQNQSIFVRAINKPRRLRPPSLPGPVAFLPTPARARMEHGEWGNIIFGEEEANNGLCTDKSKVIRPLPITQGLWASLFSLAWKNFRC